MTVCASWTVTHGPRVDGQNARNSPILWNRVQAIKVGRPQVCVGRLPVWSVWGVRVPGPSGRGVRRVRNEHVIYNRTME